MPQVGAGPQDLLSCWRCALPSAVETIAAPKCVHLNRVVSQHLGWSLTFHVAWRQTSQCSCWGRVAVDFTSTQLIQSPGGLQPSQLLGNSEDTRCAQLDDAGNRPVLLSFSEVKALEVPASPSFLHDSKFTSVF